VTDTPKLKLPIELGKTYRRRDGKTVTVREPEPGCDASSACVRLPGETDITMGCSHVWRSCGLVSPTGSTYRVDLVEGPLDEVPSAKPALQGHPHAELMAQYAEDARRAPEPWLLWETRDPDLRSDYWSNLHQHPRWEEDMEYRRKPEPVRTININGYEVPEPLQEAPKDGTPYWTPTLYQGDLTSPVTWRSDLVDLRVLQRGLIHLTREAAEAHAKALLSFTAKEAS